jgi:hypothetical protein
MKTILRYGLLLGSIIAVMLFSSDILKTQGMKGFDLSHYFMAAVTLAIVFWAVLLLTSLPSDLEEAWSRDSKRGKARRILNQVNSCLFCLPIFIAAISALVICGHVVDRSMEELPRKLQTSFVEPEVLTDVEITKFSEDLGNKVHGDIMSSVQDIVADHYRSRTTRPLEAWYGRVLEMGSKLENNASK